MEQLDNSVAAHDDPALGEGLHRHPRQLLQGDAGTAEELHQQVQALLVQRSGRGEQAEVLRPRQLRLHVVHLQGPHGLQIPAAQKRHQAVGHRYADVDRPGGVPALQQRLPPLVQGARADRLVLRQSVVQRMDIAPVGRQSVAPPPLLGQAVQICLQVCRGQPQARRSRTRRGFHPAFHRRVQQRLHRPHLLPL